MESSCDPSVGGGLWGVGLLRAVVLFPERRPDSYICMLYIYNGF